MITMLVDGMFVIKERLLYDNLLNVIIKDKIKYTYIYRIPIGLNYTSNLKCMNVEL